MPDIESEYAIPRELMDFVDQGVLEVLSERPEEKTVEFHIPRLAYNDPQDRLTSYVLKWIHPDFNAQFCDYYLETPGDLPNFTLVKEMQDSGEENIDLESLDDLTAWLADLPKGRP